MIINIRKVLIIALLFAGAIEKENATAHGRYFTYSYEPETMPEGAIEFEQWVTLRARKNQKDNFNRWDIREEFEYGVTDNYTIGFYLNLKSESFRDPSTQMDMSEFKFKGISLENRYLVLNPAEHSIGLTLYLEGGYSGDEAAIEQKIIIGQRSGNWKWAMNFIHETEWEDNFHEKKGEVELTFGITRNLSKRWAAGIEFRNLNEIPEYEDWEHSTFFLGPVATYRAVEWWATLTILPTIFTHNYGDSVDHNGERMNIRLIFGVDL